MIMKVFFRPKYLLFMLVMIVMAFIQGCAYEQVKPDTPIPVPKGLPSNTLAIVAFTSDGRLELKDAQGDMLPRCQICTPELEKKYGDLCKQAPPKIQVCGSFPPMQMREMTTFNVLHMKGSDCWFSWPLGNWIYWWPEGCTPK